MASSPVAKDQGQCEAQFLGPCPTCGRSQVLTRCTAKAERAWEGWKCCRECHPTQGTRSGVVFGKEGTALSTLEGEDRGKEVMQ